MSSPAPTEAQTDPALDALVPGTCFRLIPKTGPEGFRMGRRGGPRDEDPVHDVVITHDFYMADIPVTQQQFREWTSSKDYEDWFHANRDRIDGGEPHRNEFEGDDHPAESVTWYEAKAFCDWLNQKHQNVLQRKGWRFRLPTEAEWEYACRRRQDGSIAESDYWSGDGEEALERIGWYGGNSGGRTHPVRSSPHPEGSRHPLGLFSLHGNVAEWCENYYFTRQYCFSEALDRDPCQTTPVAELTDNDKFWRRAADVFRGFEQSLAVTEDDEWVLTVIVSAFGTSPDPSWKKAISVCQEAKAHKQWPPHESKWARNLAAFAENVSKVAVKRVRRGGSWVKTSRARPCGVPLRVQAGEPEQVPRFPAGAGPRGRRWSQSGRRERSDWRSAERVGGRWDEAGDERGTGDSGDGAGVADGWRHSGGRCLGRGGDETCHGRSGGGVRVR